MIKILFICHGNICRSVSAQMIMNTLIKEKNLSGKIEASSAGTSNEEEGNGIFAPALKELKLNNIQITPHKAHRVTDKEFEESDYVYVMDNANYRNMLRRFPQGEDKIYMLLENKEVEDPWYTGNFSKVFDEIYLGCNNILNTLF